MRPKGFLYGQYSEEFDRLRKNRVQVSYHKYGPAAKNFGEGRVDAYLTALRCLEAFEKDHNLEHLVDAANYLMFRYMYPMPGERFWATTSSETVVEDVKGYTRANSLPYRLFVVKRKLMLWVHGIVVREI